MTGLSGANRRGNAGGICGTGEWRLIVPVAAQTLKCAGLYDAAGNVPVRNNEVRDKDSPDWNPAPTLK